GLEVRYRHVWFVPAIGRDRAPVFLGGSIDDRFNYRNVFIATVTNHLASSSLLSSERGRYAGLLSPSLIVYPNDQQPCDQRERSQKAESCNVGEQRVSK